MKDNHYWFQYFGSTEDRTAYSGQIELQLTANCLEVRNEGDTEAISELSKGQGEA